MKSLVAVFIAAAATSSFAQTTVRPVEQPAPAVTHTVVNDGPEWQTDPQISGNLVSYTDDVNGAVTIRYYDFASGTDSGVPNNGELDFLSDVSAGRIVFTRITTDTSVYLYDTTSGAPPAELYAEDDASRHGPSIGGDTVVWQDFKFNPSPLEPEIVIYDIAAGTRERLTFDALLDWTPDVSPDGSEIVWTKCNTSGLSCEVWKAVKTDLGWVTSQVTFSAGEESRPATDGQRIVYASSRNGEQDIYYNVNGVETRLEITGVQQNPNIRAGVIVFEHLVGTTSDLMAYDIEAGNLYRVTNTPTVSEMLADVWVQMDGLVRIVYVVNDFFLDVHALSFSLASKTAAQKLQDLRDFIASLLLHHGLTNSLTTKLDNVQAKLNAGETTAACNQLQAFINECTAQRGKKLTDGPDGEAQALIDAATAIRIDLGCS